MFAPKQVNLVKMIICSLKYFCLTVYYIHCASIEISYKSEDAWTNYETVRSTYVFFFLFFNHVYVQESGV